MFKLLNQNIKNLNKQSIFNFAKIKKLKKKVEIYNIFQALQLVKAHSVRHFSETVDVVFQYQKNKQISNTRLGINTTHGEQQVRGSCNMPEGLKKAKKIAVLCEPNMRQEVIDAGCDLIIDQEQIADLKEGKINFEVLYSTTDAVQQLKPFARLLGPKGMFPNTKVGTLVPQSQLILAVKQAKMGQIAYRADVGSNLHAQIGATNFDDMKLLKNLQAVIKSLEEKKPTKIKRDHFFKKAFIKSSMGPMFQVNMKQIDPDNKGYILSGL